MELIIYGSDEFRRKIYSVKVVVYIWCISPGHKKECISSPLEPFSLGFFSAAE
jgi:hypothetical protein